MISQSRISVYDVMEAYHNCEGQAEALFDVLYQDRTWLELVPMERNHSNLFSIICLR